MTVAEAAVSLDAIRHNARLLRSRAGSARLMAVVKADAYGHGLEVVGRALAPLADALAVAHLDEAERLRRAGITTPVVLLHGVMTEDELQRALGLELELVIHRPGQVELLERLRPAGLAPLWLKVDSGMHRLGVPPESLADLQARLQRLSGRPPRLMSHLACADEPEGAFHQAQVRRFLEFTQGLPGERSLANSAALLAHAETALDWVRPGIALYGVSPFPGDEGRRLGLRPAMRLSARLLDVRPLAAGESVGYGAAWRASKPIRLGVAAIGYGDGYPRHCPSGTPVWIRGRTVPLVGRVSMDLITVDLSAVPEAVPGDRLILWGGELAVERVAESAGTIAYELLTRVSARVRHRYEGEDGQGQEPLSV